jgi:two-component system, LytTR family, sensor kinase
MQISKYWLCQMAGWGSYFCFETTVNFASGRDIKTEIPYSLLLGAMGILFTHTYKYFILNKMEWNNRSLEALIIRLVTASIIVGSVLAAYMCFQAIVVAKERPSFKFYYFLVFFLNMFLLSFAWNLIFFMWKYIQSNRKLSYEKIEMEVTNKELELKNIKSNLQPHFIFNALNSIKALVDEDPDKARISVTQLSNILRNSIVSEKEQLVTLQKELKIVNDYLALECIRYEERLHVDYEINELTIGTMIPPLILQTVVENAIKHGIAAESAGGFIHIKTQLTNDSKTLISIENSGTYLPLPNNENGGFGLSASTKRLQFIFGNVATLVIHNTQHNTVLTTITLPFTAA